MTSISLSADCARCAALCCMALAFDKSRLFGLDKAAGVACPHLDARGACAIHASRAQRGFGGCVGYDCLGAGQRATQLFGGRSWLEDPALLEPMANAFGAMQRAHRLLQLLRQAKALALPAEQERRRARLEAEIERADAAADAIAELEARTHSYLRGLGPWLARVRDPTPRKARA